MRVRSLRLASLLLILAFALVLNAKRPMSAKLDVAPNPVRPGETLAITSALINNTNELQTIAVLVEVSGPCGVTASRGYKILLNGHESDTSKASFQAPACAGGYQATLTASSHDGVLLGTASASFEVSPRETAGNSK